MPSAVIESHKPEVTDALLQQITQRIVDAYQPYRVVLFGSYAYGTPHAGSDVDLLVIMDCDPANYRIGAEAAAIACVDGLAMDLLVRTPADIERRLAMGDFFLREVLEKGCVLYQSKTDWGKVEFTVTMTLLEEWIEKAEEDYTACVSMMRPRKKTMYDFVCYHAQQCAEKYLKAYLVKQNTPPPRTHDLDDLLNECVKYDAALAVLKPLAVALRDYSVKFRYPGDTATDVQAKNAIVDVRAFRKVMRKKLGI